MTSESKQHKIDLVLESFQEDASPIDRVEKGEVTEFATERHLFAVEQIEDLRHYRELRQSYSQKVFVFMCFWCGLMFLTLAAQGLSWIELGNAVLVTLTGGTTASVIGLVGFIVQGLFNSKHNGK